MQFGIYLVRRGFISPDQFVDAVERQLRSRPLIGQIALQAGVCSVAQVSRILRAQTQSKNHESFGTTAVRLGCLDRAQLAQLLGAQQERQSPLADVLVEMGALSPTTKTEQLGEFYDAMSCAAELGDV
jgi:hypothetical protein